MTSILTDLLHQIRSRVAGHHPSSSLVYFVVAFGVCIADFSYSLADTITLSNGVSFRGKVISANGEAAVIDDCRGKIENYTWKKVSELEVNGTCEVPPIDPGTGAPTNCSGKWDVMRCIVIDNVELEKTCYTNINYKDGIIHLYGREDRRSVSEETGSYDLVHKTYTDNHGKTTSFKAGRRGLTVYLFCGK
jgi:hypothetical protein